MALDGMIFDLDGTLVDTNAAHVHAWGRAFERFDYRVAPDRIAEEIGKGGDKLVPSVLGAAAEASDGEALRAAQGEEFRRLARRNRLPAFPGVRELIDALRERGIRIALATSSGRDNYDAIAHSSGLPLDELGDVVVTSDDAAESKPAPDLVHAALDRLGMSPGQCAMIGDTPFDALACRDAGVACLGVLSGGNPAERLLDAGTRRVWADVAALHRDLDTALAVASPGPARLTAQVLEQLMREALNAARAGLEAGEAPIGAVLARTGGEIVARGWNRLRASADPTAHAEIIAFREAAGCLPPGEEDLVLVSTVEPCTMCTGAAMEYGVEAVVYGAPAPLDGGTRRVTPPRHPGFRMPRMIGPVLPDAARALLAHWLPRAPDPRQRAWAESLLTPSP